MRGARKEGRESFQTEKNLYSAIIFGTEHTRHTRHRGDHLLQHSTSEAVSYSLGGDLVERL